MGGRPGPWPGRRATAHFTSPAPAWCGPRCGRPAASEQAGCLLQHALLGDRAHQFAAGRVAHQRDAVDAVSGEHGEGVTQARVRRQRREVALGQRQHVVGCAFALGALQRMDRQRAQQAAVGLHQVEVARAGLGELVGGGRQGGVGVEHGVGRVAQAGQRQRAGMLGGRRGLCALGDHAVQRQRLAARRGVVRRHRADHRRQQQRRRQRHLEHHQHRHQRGLAGGRQERAHAHQRQQRRRARRRALQAERQQLAQRRADEQRRREHAADRARAHADHRRRQLGQQHGRHRHAQRLLLQQGLDGGKAVADHLRHRHRQHADQRAAERQPRHRPARQRREAAAREAGRAQEQRARDAGGHSQRRRGQQDLRAQVRGDIEAGIERLQPAVPLADHGAGDGGQEQRHQALHRERAEHHFGDKDRGGKRGVVDGGKACRGAAGGQHAAHVGAAAALDPGRGEQRSAQRRQLDHRALLADRAAADDRAERRQRAQQGDPHRQPAAAVGDRFHVVGGAGMGAGQAVGQHQQAARERAADGRHHHAPRQRQRREHRDHVGMAGKQHHARAVQRFLEQRRGDGGDDPDRDGREQGDFLVFEETQAHGGFPGRPGDVPAVAAGQPEAVMIAQRHPRRRHVRRRASAPDRAGSGAEPARAGLVH
ncbi:hypothetical protein CBM2589_B30279 [Cupriavidus taiwanensis]|uniref:Uncharacterized protein n=1 Tax=Cupriavidus taiwanensis TaxID=164546 RepID=A0A976A2C5_9BURK|nr:hypothetical protein CBM2589_B30279 [Cupriavidus taiwanensis]